MFTDYSHKQIKSEYNKGELQEEADKRGLSTSGTKDELAERIKDYDADGDDDESAEEEFMFPHAENGPTTVTAENREEAREKLLDDNTNQ